MGVAKAAYRSSPFSRAAKAKAAAHTGNIQVSQFEAGQKVVYPGFGVGQIISIESKEIAGTKISFYMIRVLESGVTLMLPLTKVADNGVRPIATTEQVKEIYKLLKEKRIVVEMTTWNRRHREYMEKVRTGSVYEIAEVVRDLFIIRADKVLSFGEKKMLDLAKGLLVKELAIAETSDEPTIEAQIESYFGPAAA